MPDASGIGKEIVPAKIAISCLYAIVGLLPAAGSPIDGVFLLSLAGNRHLAYNLLICRVKFNPLYSKCKNVKIH